MNKSIFHTLVIVLFLQSGFALSQERFLDGQLIGEDTTNIRFDEKSVWVKKNELEVLDKFETSTFTIKPFEHKEIYLNNSKIISIVVGEDSIFLRKMIFQGKASLYANMSRSEEIFYLQMEGGKIEEIDKENIGRFLKERMRGKGQATDKEIENIILPSRSVYSAQFFENVVYAYNAEQEPEKFKPVKTKLRYKPLFGVVGGIISNGVSVGAFMEIPLSSLFRFDVELIYSSYTGDGDLNFGRFSTGVFQSSIGEVSVPIGMRATPLQGGTRIDFQGGLVPKYLSFKFDETPLIGPQETSNESFRMDPYVGIGFSGVLNERNVFGIDCRLINGKHQVLTQILLRLTL